VREKLHRRGLEGVRTRKPVPLPRELARLWAARASDCSRLGWCPIVTPVRRPLKIEPRYQESIDSISFQLYPHWGDHRILPYSRLHRRATRYGRHINHRGLKPTFNPLLKTSA
jgi:hypothetical protein